jgi:hypothetical protein
VATEFLLTVFVGAEWITASNALSLDIIERGATTPF